MTRGQHVTYEPIKRCRHCGRRFPVRVWRERGVLFCSDRCRFRRTRRQVRA